MHLGSPEHRFERHHGEGAWKSLGETHKSTQSQRCAGVEHWAGFWKTVLAAARKHPKDPALSVLVTPSKVVILCFMRTGATVILCPQDSGPSPTQCVCVQWLMQMFAEGSERDRGRSALSG